MSVTATLEKQILARACTDPSFRARARSVIDKGSVFSDQTISWVWRQILTLPSTEAITRASMMALVELGFKEDKPKEELHAAMVDLVFEEAKKPDIASLASTEVLSRLMSHAKLETAVVEASNMLSKGDTDGAWRRIESLRRRTEGRSLRRIDYAASIPDRIETMMKQEGPAFTVIPTRIKTIDKYIIGLRLTELGLIVASTGKGKSICAVNFAAASALQGHVTAVFNTEMLIDQVAMRYDSNLTKMEHRRFKTWSFSEEEQERLFQIFETRMEQLTGRLFLFDAPIRECRLDVVESAVLELEDELGQPVEEVVIDSPDHFKSDHRYDQKRIEVSDVFWDLKAMARGEGAIGHPIALWATDQAKQEYEHRFAGSSATSESYDKARICDVMVTINQDKDQEVNGEMVMNLAKVRDSQAKAQVKLRSLFSIMAFDEIGEVERKHTDLVHDTTEGGE